MEPTANNRAKLEAFLARVSFDPHLPNSVLTAPSHRRSS